uniref:DNA-directed primase/polymerase n=1 Tax=Clandestinovirus TaxID=2831644 RepID=A0A8F8PN95_9VIRU|nr:DNA-directed primase/polymerase [Clandestinovirus]
MAHKGKASFSSPVSQHRGRNGDSAIDQVKWTFWSGYKDNCPLNVWLVKNNFYFTSKDKLDQWCIKNNMPPRNPTHLILNYGIAYVPDEKMSDFFRLYSESVPISDDCGPEQLENGDISYDIGRPGLYFTENRTPVFRMFVDMDLKVAAKMGEDSRKKILSILQRSVKQCYLNCKPPGSRTIEDYSEHISEMVVLGTPVRAIDDTNLKYGYHIIFPNLEVTSEGAETIRRFIIYSLIQEEELKGMNWLDIIDGSVYHGSGLRLPHSFKMEFCKCRNPNKNDEQEDDEEHSSKPNKYDPNCYTCFGTGRYPWHNTYTCQTVYKGDGKVDDRKTALYRRDIKLMLENASIRTTRDVPGNPDPLPIVDSKVVNDGLRYVFGEECLAKSIATQKKKRHTSIPGEDGVLSSSQPSTSRLINLSPTDERFKAIVTGIKTLYPELKPRIADIRFYETYTLDPVGGEMIDPPNVFLAREQHGNCLNLDLEGKKGHRSHTTYFVVKPTGISQRCFCQCADYTSRTSGKKCSEFESVPRKVRKTVNTKTINGPDGVAEEEDEIREIDVYALDSAMMTKVFPSFKEPEQPVTTETWDPLKVTKAGSLQNIENKKIDFGVSYLSSYVYSPSSNKENEDTMNTESDYMPSTPSSTTSYASSTRGKKRTFDGSQKFVVPYLTFQEQSEYKTLSKVEEMLKMVARDGPFKAGNDRAKALTSTGKKKTAAGSITISSNQRVKGDMSHRK